jgi:hypothetical protein
MAAPTFPTGVSARGNDSVIWVPTLADPAAPTVTELTGASAVNLSCALIGFSPSVDQGTFTDTRLCSKQTFNRLGQATFSIDTLNYVYNPQTAGETPADSDNIAYDALQPGLTGFFVHRRGLDAQTVDVLADQKVNVYPAELGAQSDVPLDPTADGALIQCQQNVSVIGEVLRDVAIVAGA